MRSKILSLALILLVIFTYAPAMGYAEENEAIDSMQVSEESLVTENNPMPGISPIPGEEETIDELDVHSVLNCETMKWDATMTWVGNSARHNVWIDAKRFDEASYRAYGVIGGTYTFTDIAQGKHTFYVSTTDGSLVVKKTVTISGLKITAKSSYKAVRLSWNKLKGVTGYVITRSTDKDGDFKTRKVIQSPNTTTYVDSVAVDTKYYYVIYAYSGTTDNLSEGSNMVSRRAVRVMKIKFTFAATRTLTSHSGGKETRTFKKGFTTNANGFADGKYHFVYKGKTYYVSRISTKNHKVSSVSTDFNYTKAEAQDYVNRRGLSSDTPYLIWVNTYTQREYIFTGKKGNWNVKYSWEISTGKPETPTKVGVTHIKWKVPERNNLHYWNICSQFSIHNKANSWKLGYPRSGGCVRNTTEHAKWIYDTCPVDTTVCIY